MHQVSFIANDTTEASESRDPLPEHAMVEWRYLLDSYTSLTWIVYCRAVCALLSDYRDPRRVNWTWDPPHDAVGTLAAGVY